MVEKRADGYYYIPMDRYFMLIFPVLLFSCGGIQVDIPLTAQARMVKVTKKLPPQFCHEVGEVYASHSGPGEELERIVHSVRNSLRNKAASAGANYVTVDTNHITVYWGKTVLVVSGTTYKCRLLSRDRRKRKNPFKVIRKNAKKKFHSKEVTETDIDEAVRSVEDAYQPATVNAEDEESEIDKFLLGE